MSVVNRTTYKAQKDVSFADNTNELIKALTLRTIHDDLADSVAWLTENETISGAWTFAGNVVMSGNLTIGGVTLDTSNLVTRRIATPTDGYIPKWDNANGRLDFDSFANLLTADDVTGFQDLSFDSAKTIHLPTNPNSTSAGAMKFTGGNLSIYDGGWQIVGTINASSSVLKSGTPSSGQIVKWTGVDSIEGVDSLEKLKLSKTTGLNGSAPAVLEINSTNNGNWTIDAEPMRVDFSTQDISGTGAGSVRASIRCYIPTTEGNLYGLKFYTNDGTGLIESIRLANSGNVFLNKRTNIEDSTEASNTTTASLQTDGGLAVVKKAIIGGDISCNSTTDSSSTASGSIQTDGGLGVAKKAYFGDAVEMQNDLAILGDTNTKAVDCTGILKVIRPSATTQYFELFAENGGVKLNVAAASGAFTISTNGGSTAHFKIDGIGDASLSSLGTGTVYSNSGTLTNTNPSDKRLKENFKKLNYGLNEVLQLEHHWYNYKGEDRNHLGWIAQEVQSIMPKMITSFTKKVEGDTKEYLGLNIEAMPVLNQRAIQEFYSEYRKEIQLLKSEIQSLKKKQS